MGIYLIARTVAKKSAEDESIDDDNPYLKMISHNKDCKTSIGAYESKIKPALDHVLSFGGMLVLSPLYFIISLAIVIDDPGPIFFIQKRIGKKKHYIQIHKFRSMAVSAPHNIPTHQLENPMQYITKVGAFLRRTSLDELPQIWDIFRGKMSIVGPRPALWNQNDLVAEREKYHANDVMPGLTGLAQIKGRDELEIPDKAKYDGKYVKILRKDGMKAFNQDIKCLIGTIGSVLKHEGVVEGGTGAFSGSHGLKPVKRSEVGFEKYGNKKFFHIDKTIRKKVLIAGADSYIGESLEEYCRQYYPNIECMSIDMTDEKWRTFNFSGFDTVFHVAGIAHADVRRTSKSEQEKYYSVNTYLANECAQKSKEQGVKQFIFMSSMLIYGDREFVDEYTLPKPDNFYSDSKWQADKGVRKLDDESFHVAVLRAPMIYGKGSKGNYPILSKLAKNIPIFPQIDNCRSMLYIENFCEFISLLILSGEGGIYFPQNKEYSNTSSIVKMIGKATGHKVWLSKMLSPIVEMLRIMPGDIHIPVDKAFGSNIYDQRLSQYEGLNYHLVSLEESIRRTENNKGERSGNKIKKRALILASVASMIDLFNADNINILSSLGYQVDVAANFNFGSITSQKRVNEYKQELMDYGIKVYNMPIPRDLSKIKDMEAAYREIKHLVDSNHYDIVHCHSPIGGVLCRLACRKSRKYGTKVIYTAHGFHFFKGATRKAWMIYYPVEKMCSLFTDLIITINHEDYKTAKKFRSCMVAYVPGIGIHVDKIKNATVDRESKREELGYERDDFVFMSTGQVSYRKNHEVVIRAMAQIPDKKSKYLIVGFGEEEERLKKLVQELNLQSRVTFAGYRSDVIELLHAVDAFVFPSIQEGLPVALMEAMAAGLPIICSKIRGNVDLIEDGKNGWLVDCHSSEEFSHAMERVKNEETSEMIDQNFKSIRKFDIDRVNNKMTDLYKAIARK